MLNVSSDNTRKASSQLLQGVCSLPLSPLVEVPVFVLRVLSELSLLLLGQESAGAEESHEANAKDRKREQEERSQIINVFKSTLFPRYVWLRIGSIRNTRQR